MSGMTYDDHFVITADEKAGLVVIVAAIGVSWTVLTLVIRIVSKLQIKHTLGLEEVLVILASLLACVTSACVLAAVKFGFGRKGNASNSPGEETVLKLLWIADILYILTLAIAKAAALPLLAQLTPIKHFVKASWLIAIFIVIWCVISVFLVALRCHPISPWFDATLSQCDSVFQRWSFVETTSISIEILIFGLFLTIIRMLRMRLKAKVKVMLAFSTRLTVIVPTVFRLIYLSNDLDEGDPTFSLVSAIIAAQAVLHYTTMAASFAYLKPFLRAFDSNLGATVKVDTVVSEGYPGNSQSREYSSKDDSKPKLTSSSSTTNHSNKSGRDRRRESILRSKRNDNDTSLRRLSAQHMANTGESPNYLSSAKRNSHRKLESTDSFAPIIKTQEWNVHTEPRDASLEV